LAHLIELEWLDDRHHELHLSHPSMLAAEPASKLIRQRERRRRVKPRANSPLTAQGIEDTCVFLGCGEGGLM
jgi:hypothetical protein